MKTRLFWFIILICLITGLSAGCDALSTMTPMETEAVSSKDAVPPIGVSLGRDKLEPGQEVVEFIASDSPYSVEVLFTASEPVQSFRLLDLADGDFDEDGNLQFTVSESFHLDTLTPENPIVARIVFLGTIPNNGFSYVDASGMAHRYTLSQSGEDGSLITTAF